MRFRTTHMASCKLRLASSTIILFPPRTSTVTALELAQSSITSMRSVVLVPKVTSRTHPARPSLSALNSEKRGTIRPPVAMAMCSISTPPTHRTAGSLFWSSRWVASSSNPHWQITRLAPESFTCCTISVKYFCSYSYSFSYASRLLISSLCLVLGFGGSKGHVRMHILASLITLAIWGCAISLSITIPFTSSVSSNDPPGLPSIRIMSKFTS
mmetsp:Transcript_37663/g.38018  ORF Transcript_37663/g.38018 Transcript_37663/m.38018 type:complete len:213 (-) Transcript_37663:648-1286(-)